MYTHTALHPHQGTQRTPQRPAPPFNPIEAPNARSAAQEEEARARRKAEKAVCVRVLWCVCVCVCVFVCVCLCFFQVYLASGLLSWLWVFMSLTFFFNFFFPNFVSFVGLIDGSIVYISYIGRQKDGYIDIEICINHPPPHTPPPQR